MRLVSPTLVERGLALLAIPVLLILWLLRPIAQVRLLVVASHRFGHLALEPEMWIGSRSMQQVGSFPKCIELWSFGSTATQCNRYLVRLWSGQVSLTPSWVVGMLIRGGQLFPTLALKQQALSVHGPRNALDSIRRSGLRCPLFTEGEVNSLRRHGFVVDRPYVALIVRDSAHYLSRGEREDEHTAIFNADLSTFVPACESLVSRGLQVVRLGGPSLQRLPKLDGCFDYANSSVRSDSLDVKLASHCEFAVSTQTGPDAVALLGRRPVLYVDVLRFSQFFWGTRLATWFPRSIRMASDDQELTLDQICDSKLLFLKQPESFSDTGWSFTRSSADEIRDYVVDYLDELTFGVDEGTTMLRARVNSRLQDAMGPWGWEVFGEIRAPISRQWLKMNYR